MGVSVSKNTVQSMINDVNSIISTYENICSATGTSTVAQVTAVGCSYGNNNKIIVQGDTYVSQSCLQNNKDTNTLKSSVQQSLKQTAKAITQSFGFPSFTDAQNFIDNSVKLGDNIVDFYNNNCISNATNTTSKVF